MRMLVLGAGLQGSACAYDLLQNADVAEVHLADLRVDEPPTFLAPYVGGRLTLARLDVRDRQATQRAMRAADAVLCATPYDLNLELAKQAIEAGVHFCDLGGNTESVFQQQQLTEQARDRGVSVVPDCGLAPGTVNILAQQGIDQLDEVDSVRLFVGGLPQHPSPPLNYQLVYSLEGLLDYYTTPCWTLRGGARTRVPPLSDVEMVELPEPLGRLEAFHTAGGLSTMAFRYEGKIRLMEYKTLRYPGHVHLVAAMRDLGLFDRTAVSVGGVEVAPRDVVVQTIRPRLTKPGALDLVALRVDVEGWKDGAVKRLRWELVDWYDTKRGISAMMRTTGFALSIVGQMLVRGEVKPAGVFTPDECIPPKRYISDLAKRGIEIREIPV